MPAPNLRRKIKSRIRQPDDIFEPRPFVSQTKVSMETPSTIVYDKKFDTAIRASHIEQHYTRIENKKLKPDDVLTTKIKNYPKNNASIDECSSMYSKIMLDIFRLENENNTLSYHDSSTTVTTNRIIQLIHKNVTIQMLYLNKNNYLESNYITMQEMKKIFEKEQHNHGLISRVMDFSNWWLGVMNKSNQMYSNYYTQLTPDEKIKVLSSKNHAVFDPLKLEISWSHNFCVIFHDSIPYLLPKSYILLIHNKLCDLLSVMIYARYAQHSCLPHNAYHKTLDFIEEMWTLSVEYGQKFFTIAKCLEALATGETLIEIESWDNSSFLKLVIKDLYSDVGFMYPSSRLRQILKQASIPFRNELGCLSKMAGHPFVDMKDGSEKLHKYTTEEYILDQEKINECLCYAKQNYIRNHIVREHAWPPHVINSKKAPMSMQKASLLNVDPESYDMRLTYGPISIQDYNYVDLKPNMQFHYLENTIPYLKDKTISLFRSSVVSYYINQQKDMKVSWKDTRLLLFYLLREDDQTDHVSFIKDYSKIRDLNELIDYLVIRVVPKEKELKTAYRGFGCTTYHNRMLFLAQEKNAMHYLDLYCDEQAMTLSEIDMVKRLYAFRSLKQAYPKHKVYYATIDANKWNNHFRPETCDDIQAELLDAIFGVSIYGKTQKKFQSTLIYVPDGDTTYHWDGQSGGIEGLNQDTWVITYIAQIKTSLSGMDIKYHLLCKGDDLRLAILVPEHDIRSAAMKETSFNIMSSLAEAAAKVGHEIKIYESYGSERYFCFSKAASVDKIELPQVYRKIQKCYGASNAFLPTFEEYIASTFSNAHSACRVSTNFLPCYIVALFWSFYYLLSDAKPKFVKRSNRKKDVYTEKIEDLYYSDFSDDELTALLLCPGLSGGFPIIYLQNMMTRAESDLLAPFIDIYNFVKTRFPIVGRIMSRFLFFSNLKKKTWKPVYADPYCLPLQKPITATQTLKQSIRPALSVIAKNEQILGLLDLVDNDLASRLCMRSMDDSKIVHAKVFSLLYSCFPESILNEVVNKFESSRSVMELLILRGGVGKANSILRQVIRADRKVENWRKNRLLNCHTASMKSFEYLITSCPAESAEKIRCETWQKPVDGITMPPIAHLVHFYPESVGISLSHVRQNHFTYHTVMPDKFLDKDQTHHFAHGKVTPFLGKITSPSTHPPMLHLVEKDTILSKLKNIAELATWVSTSAIDDKGVLQESNVSALIDKLICLYTNEPLETFAPLAGTKDKGTIAHHVRVRRYRESIVPNSLSNFYQYTSGNSNQHRKFGQDRGHYWINFLHCFCHINCILMMELNVSRFFTIPEMVWVSTEMCDFCMRDIREPVVQINVDILKRVRFPQLQLTKLNQRTLKILQVSLGVQVKKVYNDDGHIIDLTPIQATLGLFNNVVDSTIRRTKAIADRYTQHPDNPEGRYVMSHFVSQSACKTISMKDISRMDTTVLAQSSCIAIFQSMIKHLNPQIYPTLDVSIMAMPAHTLPWYPLIEALNKAQKLTPVVKYMVELTNVPMPALMYRSEQIAPFIASIVTRMLLHWSDQYPLVLLSNYKELDIKRVVQNYMYVLIWSHFYKYKYLLEDRGNNANHYQDKMTLIWIVIILLSSNIVQEEDNSIQIEQLSNGLVFAHNIIGLDFEKIDNDLNSQDDTILKKKFSPHLNILSLLTDIPVYMFLDFIHGFSASVMSSAIMTYESFQMEVIIATPANCLETIRSQEWADDDEYNTRDDYDLRLELMANFFVPNREAPHNHFTEMPPFDENSAYYIDAPTIDFTMHKRINITDEYLWRPFGRSNDTINRLAYIFHYLTNLGYKGDMQGLSIHAMGDGVGNGTCYLAGLFHQSRIIFTTKSEVRGQVKGPIAAYDMIENNLHVVVTSHLQESIWDLSQHHVVQHLAERYGGHHIYFCDAEQQPGPMYIYELSENVVWYYLLTRTPHSLLIMQLTFEETNRFSQILHILHKYCLHVIVVLPPSIRCIYSHYVVAWGLRKHYYGDKSLFPTKISLAINSATTRILDKAQNRVNAIHGTANAFISLQPRMPRYALFLLNMPPLWVSYLQKSINKIVTTASIDAMKNTLMSCQNLKSTILFLAPSLNNEILSYRKMLQGNTRDEMSKHQTYDMNYHQHRVIIVNYFMVASGWTTALSWYKTTSGLVPILTARSEFLRLCETLPTRDYDNSNIHYIDTFNRSGMKHPNGMKLDYWRQFLSGVGSAQSFITWCTTFHHSSNNMN